MALSFLTQETKGTRTQETFTGKKCEIFVPEYFFNKDAKDALAKELGDRIETVGLIWFKVDDSDLYEMQLPIKIQFEFSSQTKKRLKLKPELPEESYNVFTLNTGDAFIYNILHRKDVDDIRIMFTSKLVENAKLPKTISYRDVLSVFMNAITSSGDYGLGVSSVSIEIMLSELYRNKKNLQEPFRLAYNGKNNYDYKAVRIIKLPELNSTFTSLIGEDINNQLISSVVRAREGKTERISPAEKIIKY